MTGAIADSHNCERPPTLDAATFPGTLLTRHGNKLRHFMTLHMHAIRHSIHTFATSIPFFFIYPRCAFTPVTIRYINEHQHHVPLVMYLPQSVCRWIKPANLLPTTVHSKWDLLSSLQHGWYRQSSIKNYIDGMKRYPYRKEWPSPAFVIMRSTLQIPPAMWR